MFKATILKDSINGNESRLTTVELTYPRCIHSEFMTHRLFSRNAASSRAIPVAKMIRDVRENPFVPTHWGKNQKGMQAWEEIGNDQQATAMEIWLSHRETAIEQVCFLVGDDIQLHKQIANRLLEPWMWITVIASGTDAAYRNFFKLRCDKHAEPHIQKIAYMLQEEYKNSDPETLKTWDYHLPLIGFEGDEVLTQEEAIKVSVGRCARVSYLTHQGTRDVQADIQLHDRLAEAGHWSPFEHVAQNVPGCLNTGNFAMGWAQYRKLFATECA